jgi:hypothetical protein
MNWSAFLIIAGMLSAGTAAAQSDKDMQTNPQTSASTPAQNANGTLASGSSIDAALTKSLDTKKAKKGDPVTARITEDAKQENGSTVIPKGSKLEGHVTQASSREKGDSYSTLGIVFDKAILKNGEEVPLNVQVQALAISQDAATAPPPSAGMGGMSSPAGGGGGAAGMGRPGGSGGSPGATSSTQSAPAPVPTTNTNAASNTDTDNAMAGKGAVGGLNSSGKLNHGSRGVFGLQGIGLASASEGTQQAAVVTSTEKNVHLESGTQLLLVTQGPKS